MNISAEHDNCLDFTNFSPLLTDTSNTYQSIGELSNKIDLSIYTLLEYYIGSGLTSSESLFKNISPNDLNKFLTKMLKTQTTSLKDMTAREIIVAHCSGSGHGMNLTKIRIEEDGTSVIVDDSCDRDSDTSKVNYFTKVIHLNYGDE